MSVVADLTPLQELLSQAKAQLAKSGVDGHVARIEVVRKGRIQIQVERGKNRAWYAWKGGKLRALEIAADRKVPLAARLADPAFAENMQPLSYRPGKRLTLLDRSGHKPKILKGFRQGRLDGMLGRYERAAEAFADHAIYAPEVIEYENRNQALVMVFKSGERLRLSADNADLFHLVGEGLRDFQAHAGEQDEPPFSSDDELQVLDKRSGRLAAAGLDVPEHWTALRERIGAAHHDLPDPVYGLAHRDLHDKQVIQQHNHLTVLDFDLMRPADVTLDPANFLAHLVLRNLQGVQGATQRSIDTCGKQFLQGLDRHEEAGFWERLRFYQATTFCRLALVYHVRPRWSPLVPDLLRMGHRCLDDLDRIRGC